MVVDDASTDATPRLLAEWAARDDRVRIVAAEAPMGLARALNLGLEAVRAPLVARADADDLYAPDRLARQAAAFRAAPRLDALSTGYMRIDEAGDELGAVVPVTGPEIIRFRMLWTNSLLHPGVMARTQALRAAGGYDPGLLDGAGQRPLGADGGGGGPARQPHGAAGALPGAWRLDHGPARRRRPRAQPDRAGAGAARLSGRASRRPRRRRHRRSLAGLPAAARARDPGRPRRDRPHRAAARGREGPEVMADLRATLARALWRQARWTGRRDPGLTAELLARAARWKVAA